MKALLVQFGITDVVSDVVHARLAFAWYRSLMSNMMVFES